MKSLRLLSVCAVFTMFLVGCDGDHQTSKVADASTVEFRALVQSLLARDANSEPVSLNDQVFEEQFADGEPEPVDTFL